MTGQVRDGRCIWDDLGCAGSGVTKSVGGAIARTRDGSGNRTDTMRSGDRRAGGSDREVGVDWANSSHPPPSDATVGEETVATEPVGQEARKAAGVRRRCRGVDR
jgi:hypothetical protein